MSRFENKALRNRTEYLCDKADNFEETFSIGCELEDIGRLIRQMALLIRDLQDKIDGQAEHIKALSAKAGEQETEQITCKQCDIPDINCYEQCKGCFGASFNDCEICDDRKGGSDEKL